MSIDKKIALVTGGGSGLGFAIAQKFVENGITTIIAGRDEEKLKKAKERLGKLCYAKICDVNDLASIPKFVDEVIKELAK